MDTSPKIFASKLFNTVNKVFNLAECQYFMDGCPGCSFSFVAPFLILLAASEKYRKPALVGMALFVVGHMALRLTGLTSRCIPPIFIPDVVLLYKKK